MRSILGSIVEANKKFNLIEPGDRIAVGVSGGKDSMILLYALSLYQKFADIDFEVVGITLQLGFPDMNFDRVVDFCSDKGIEYHLVKTQVYEILKRNLDKNDRIKCSLCSKLKKGILNNEAKKLNCNKVSMAHHYDDGIETLWMNAIYNGYIASFKPKMYLDESGVTFIRPLILCTEKAIKKAALKHHLPIITSTCPKDKLTAREEIKNWLNHDLYKKFPSAKLNFQNMLLHPERVILWKEDKE
ncbi:tRNA 2-thiocytidine biosynthesis protein TtcA [Mycoplasmatota bacterium]|nr:tRNA 2-thiocytidine biosynthesis protein TtcA [Mycoplasmatota bacterium]